MGFSRQEYWSGLPFPSPVDHILSALSTMVHPSWVAPRAWFSFIELDKAVVLVWLDWLVLCDYGFSVSAPDALLQHSPSYLGFSYLECRMSLHSFSSKAQPLFLTLDEGYLLTAAPPDLEHGVAPLGPPAPAQPLLLGWGVALPGRCPWPRTWGRSPRRCPWPRWGPYETLNPAPFLPARPASSKLIWHPHSLNPVIAVVVVVIFIPDLEVWKEKRKWTLSINVLIFVLCTKRSFFKPWGVTILCVFYRYYRSFGRAAL